MGRLSIKIINAYTHTHRERISKSWKELMKATLKIPSNSFLLGKFPLQCFKKSWVLPLLPPSLPSAFGNFVSLPTPFYWSPLQNAKSSLPPSETFELLLGCQYDHIVVRRMHTKVIRYVKMFLLLNEY